jgi:hypothetical protein
MTNHEAFKVLTQEYTLKLATTQEDLQAVKAVRAEVFAPKYKMSPELLESKGYLFSEDDKQSFLYLLKHIPTGKYVGTVRNFCVNNKTPIKRMPMQKDGHVEGIEHLTQKFPIVEISRGALIQNLPVHNIFSALQLRTILTYGLMIATRINFILYPYERVFSIMELSMHHILKRQKVNFEQIGEPVDYYGMRTPFAIERIKLLEETEESMGAITRHYLKALCKDPEPFWQFIDANPYLDRSDIRLERICELFKTYGEEAELSYLLAEEEEMTAGI